MSSNIKPTPSTDMDGVIEIQPFNGHLLVKNLISHSDGLLDNLLHDNCTYEEYLEFISNHPNLYQISIGGEFGGFFSLDDRGTIQSTKTCEVHAFILKHMRKYSKKFLQSFGKFIFEMSGYGAIITTIPTHTVYVVRLVESIGFTEVHYEESQFKINGEEIGMYYFCTTKSQFGGKNGFTF